MDISCAALLTTLALVCLLTPVKPRQSRHIYQLHKNYRWHLDTRYGDGQTSGTVLVTYRGAQSLVCDDLWGKEEATVVCRALGFKRAANATINNWFGYWDMDTPIVYDDLKCSGGESSLSQCPNAGLGNHNCIPEEAAGVICV